MTDPTGNYSLGEFSSDVWGGVKGALLGVTEPALIVMDFGQMAGVLVTMKCFPKEYHDVQWLMQQDGAFNKARQVGVPGEL